MNRLVVFTLGTLICVVGPGCSGSTNGKSSAPSGDPFVGFFAHPSSGALELQRADGEGKYQGSMWADFGPFAVELTREGAALPVAR
jgi:hypothetical protein